MEIRLVASRAASAMLRHSATAVTRGSAAAWHTPLAGAGTRLLATSRTHEAPRALWARCGLEAAGSRSMSAVAAEVPPVSAAEGLPPLAWSVVRSAQGNLPVYREIRNANTRELTVIRKVLGSLEALRQSIIEDFEVDPKRVWIKQGRVEVKGRHRQEVTAWLEAKGF